MLAMRFMKYRKAIGKGKAINPCALDNASREAWLNLIVAEERRKTKTITLTLRIKRDGALGTAIFGKYGCWVWTAIAYF